MPIAASEQFALTVAPSGGLAGDGRGYACFKRAIDIVGALFGLAVVSPIFLFAFAWVRLVDRGPVLFCQWRVRHGGRLFRIYKLRTMRLDAERGTGAAFSRRGDARVLPGCRWMRRAHVDELPQLWNILRGDMSLVGPRPERPEVAYEINARLRSFAKRTAVKPGLTGLAQVRAGYANDIAGHREKLRYDLLYIRTRSIRNDLGLMLGSLTKLWDRRAC